MLDYSEKIYLVLTIIFILMFLNCQSGENKLPALGDNLSDQIISNSEKLSFLISASSFMDTYRVNFNNIDYLLAINDDNEIVYIGVDDYDFKTDEGLKIGDSLGAVLKYVKTDLIKEPGWAYFITLKSGWNAAFVTGYHMTDTIPTVDSKVKWFFKR